MENNAINFPQRLNSTNHSSCQYCSTDVRAERWLWIWRDESKPSKTNNAEGCLVSHTKNTKRTNTYGSRSISSLDVKKFYCQQSSVASYYGSTMSAVKNTLPKIILQGTVDDRRRRRKPRKSWRDNMDRPVIVVVAAHRRRQKSMSDHCSGGVCRSTWTTLGRQWS